MNKKYNRLLPVNLLVGLLFLLSGIFAILLNRKIPPPVEEFIAYHNLVNQMYKAQPDQIVLDAFTNSKVFLMEAYKAWQDENNKFLLFRDYSETRRIVLIALSLAEEAQVQNARGLSEELIRPQEDL